MSFRMQIFVPQNSDHIGMKGKMRVAWEVGRGGHSALGPGCARQASEPVILDCCRAHAETGLSGCWAGACPNNKLVRGGCNLTHVQHFIFGDRLLGTSGLNPESQT